MGTTDSTYGLRWLETLAVRAGLPKGVADLTREQWDAVVAADGDELTLSVRWDMDQSQWLAGVDDALGEELLTEYFAMAGQAFAAVKAYVAEYRHTPCGDCGDTGIVMWEQGDSEGTDFCGCRFGQRAADRKDDADAEAALSARWERG